MKKFVVVISFMLFACNPVDSNKSEKPLLEAFCLGSQSQCEVNSSDLRFSVKFSQAQSVALNNRHDDTLSNVEGMNNILTELDFSIHVIPKSRPQAEIKSVQGILEGRDMFMGKIPVIFAPSSRELNRENSNVNDKNDLGNHSLGNHSMTPFVAQSLLANCTEETMVWRLWLDITYETDEGQKNQKVFIDFTGQRF